MAASKALRKKTASRCAPETEHGTHALEICGYSLLSGLGAGEFIRSTTFNISGFNWSIRFYPEGKGDGRMSNLDYAAIYLELMDELEVGNGVMVQFGFRLVNPTTGASSALRSAKKPSVFDSATYAGGIRNFRNKAEMKDSLYLQDDRLVI
ncbi:hypothetical protein ACP4OV_026995 [Aristida adscensionis]